MVIKATVALRFFDLPPCGETLGIHKKKNRRDGKPPDLERQVHPVVQHSFQVAEHTLFTVAKHCFFLCVMPWIMELSMEM